MLCAALIVFIDDKDELSTLELKDATTFTQHENVSFTITLF